MTKIVNRMVLAAVLSLAGLTSGVSHAAGSAASNFNVTIALTATCTITAPADVTFAYTSFQAGVANSGGGTFDARCTNTLPYTFGLVAGAGGAAPGAASIGPITDNAVGLVYTLNAPLGASGIGTPVTHTITGTMPAGQSGTCATSPPGTCANGTATNRTQTLIINF